MQTRLLMSASALLMAVLGLAASFLSHELLSFLDATVETQTVLIVQVLGALYLGFAILNWHSRGAAIGGIYNRPLAVGNFLHFVIASITLVKVALALSSAPIWTITIVYVVFALWFGLVLFTHPGQPS